MTKAEAVQILKAHNEWRRGKGDNQADPKTLGIAIDTAVRLLSRKPKRKP